LDLNNPRFSAAVADIASAIRGVPKDELESEEVLQHRRTVRTAWAAGAGLLILALLAGAAAIYALDQRNDAVASATRADENATEANEQRQAAEGAAAEAEEAKQEAEQQAAIATARELTLEAEKALESDPELSAHLALAALASFRQSGENPAQAVSVLRSAIANDRVTFRVPGGRFVAMHPDGSLLATTDLVDDEVVGVAVWDIATGEVVERYARPDDMDAGDGWHSAAFSPDGNLLAVAFQLAEPAMTIWDRTTGESFHIGTYPGVAPIGTVFSPDSAFVTIYTGGETEAGIQVWSIEEQRLVFETGEFGRGPDFNTAGLMSYAVDDPSGESGESSVRIVNPTTGELIQSIPTDLDELFFTQWSPDGSLIAAGDQIEVIVFDVATGAEVSRTGDVGRLFWPKWLPDGDAFVVGGELNPRVIDAATGEIRTELFGLTGGTWDYAVVPGTTLLASASLGGSDTVIFDTSQLGSVEVGGWLAPFDANTADYIGTGDRVVVSDYGSYVNARTLDGGESVFVEGVWDGDRAELSGDGGYVASLPRRLQRNRPGSLGPVSWRPLLWPLLSRTRSGACCWLWRQSRQLVLALART
jgi:hypothetical protein